MLSRPETYHFSSVEEVDDSMREMDWPLEYRQIEAGAFSSAFSIVEGENWFLLEEQSNRAFEGVGESPTGMYMLALLESDSPGVANGNALTASTIFVQAPGSDFLATIPANMKISQIGIAGEQFDRLAAHVAPNLSIADRSVSVISANPVSIDRIRHALRDAIFTPSVRETIRNEAASSIASALALTLSEFSGAPRERRLHSDRARRVLSRAREYIEENLADEILIDSMCRYAGTTLRTLERTFVRETGVTPQRYVKIRRLNAARRCLKATSPDAGMTVTEIALDHAFPHLGRFSGDYNRQFGEYPRDTLQAQ